MSIPIFITSLLCLIWIIGVVSTIMSFFDKENTIEINYNPVIKTSHKNYYKYQYDESINNFDLSNLIDEEKFASVIIDDSST